MSDFKAITGVIPNLFREIVGYLIPGLMLGFTALYFNHSIFEKGAKLLGFLEHFDRLLLSIVIAYVVGRTLSLVVGIGTTLLGVVKDSCFSWKKFRSRFVEVFWGKIGPQHFGKKDKMIISESEIQTQLCCDKLTRAEYEGVVLAFFFSRGMLGYSLASLYLFEKNSFFLLLSALFLFGILIAMASISTTRNDAAHALSKSLLQEE